MGDAKEARLAAYRSLFRTEIEPADLTAIRRAVNGGYVLGNDRFRDEVEAVLKQRAVPGMSGRPLTKPVWDERQKELF